MEENEDWKSLKTADKMAHKNWKARVEGYEELSKKITQIETQEQFDEYSPFLKRVPLDTNLPAQEKALELILKFLQYNDEYFKTISKEFFTSLVSKCLNTKPKIKTLCTDIFLQSLENNDPISVFDALKSGLTAKQPKVICACLEIFTRLLHDFGPITVAFKPFLSDSLKLLDHSDKNVRDNVKILIVEVYKWIKIGVKPFITDVKPMQLKELEEEFKKLENESLAPCRFVGGVKKVSQSKNQSEDVNEGSNDQEERSSDAPDPTLKIDPYDIIDPIDVLAKIPSTFFSEVVEVKWQTRKEALDKVEKILDVPKIKGGDFSALISCFKTIISTDSNINVISSTVKCISNLANGLRNGFSQNASSLAPLVIAMFKEKRGTIVDNCINCLDNFNQCLDFESLFNISAPFIKHKTPLVKEEVLKFVGRLISKNPESLSKPVVKFVSTELAKALEDSLPNIREVGSECLAILMNIVGERAVIIHLESVEEMKKSKIIEKYKKMNEELQPKIAKENKKPEIQKQESVKVDKKNTEPMPEKKVLEKVEKTAPSTTKSSAGKLPQAKSDSNFDQDSKDPPEISITLDIVVEKAIELFGQEFIDLLGSANWKERLATCEEIEDRLDKLSNNDFDVIHSYVLLNYKPGWKETNFQVLKVKFKVISFLCKKYSSFPSRIVHEIIQVLADKISDNKLKDQVYTTLFDLSDVSSINFVNLRLMNYFNSAKSIKNQTEILSYMSQSLIEFGMKIDLKTFLPFFKKCTDMTNPDLKKALIELLKTIYLFMGQKFRIMLDDMNSQFLQNIDSEFEKLKGMPPPQPTRVKLNQQPNEVKNDDAVEENQPSEEIDMEQFINRVDISSQLTSDLIEEIGDKNWKIRNAALEKVSEILKKSKHIQPNIGDLPTALILRLTDTNKNLITFSLNILKDLISSVGKQIDKQMQTLIPPILTTLSDGKPQIRTAAIQFLDEWASICGVNNVLDNQESILFPIITGRNSSSKYEIITWLSKIVPEKNINSKYLIPLIDPVLGCLSDRSAETRKSVQSLILEIALKVGVDTVQKKTTKLDTTSMNIVKGVLESASAKSCKKLDNQKQVEKNENNKKDLPDTSDKATKPSAKQENKETQQTVSDVTETKKVPEKEIRIICKPKTQAIRLKTFSISTMGSKEFLNWINGQIVLYFTQSITNDLLSPDFKKVSRGVQTLISIFDDPVSNEEILATLECSDLIIGFISCRLSDANPNVLSKLFDLLQKLLEFLINKRKKIYHEELECLLPSLITKLNDNKEIYRKLSRSCIQLTIQLSSPSVILNYIYSGVDSKLVKLRLECLTLFNNIIQTENVVISEINNCAKISSDMAKLLNEKDNAVRSLAINYFIMFYEQVGQNVFDFIGPLGPKETALLNDKFKRIQTNPCKTFDTSPNVNKTFHVSKSPNNSVISEKSFSAENIPNEQPKKPAFDIYEFLAESGIHIDNEDIKPTEFSIESDSEISYKFIEIKPEVNSINIPAFLNLKNDIQNKKIDEIDFKVYINDFPILFDFMDISQETVDSIVFSIQELLNYISSNGEIFSNIKIWDCFEIISFCLHLNSFIRRIDNHIFYSISFKIYEIIHICHDNCFENCEKVLSVCKAILCFVTECFPVNNLFTVYTKLIYNNVIKDSKICDYFLYLFDILLKRFQRRSPSPNIDFFKFYSDYKEFKEKLLSNIAYSSELCEIINKIFRESISLLQTQNSKLIKEIEIEYSFVEEELKNTLINPDSGDVKSVSDVIDELLTNISSKPDQRLIVCKNIMYLSIEYDYPLTNSAKFSDLHSSLKFFYRLYFDDACRDLVKTVIKFKKLVYEESTDMDYYNFYLSRSKQFGAMIDLASNKISEIAQETSQKSNEILCEFKNEQSFNKLNDNTLHINPIPEHSSPKPTPSNIEDLKRRLEHIKKGFKS